MGISSNGGKWIFNTMDELLIHAESNRGQYSLSVSDNILDFKFFPNKSDTLLIIFNAALTRTKKTVLPAFSGNGALGVVDANILMVSDPSLALSEDLTIAWYAGNHKFKLQPILSDILRQFANHFGKSRTILSGGSCGGFAAMYYSTNIPNSYAVVANPQTNISKYHERLVKNYLSDCFPNVPQDREIEEGLASTKIDYDICPDFNKSQNKLIYLQNASDRFHISNHLEPFLKINELEPAGKEEIINSLNNRISIIMGQHWGKGHVAPPKQFFFGVLGLLASGLEHTSIHFHEEVEKLYLGSMNLIKECKLIVDKNNFTSEIRLVGDVDSEGFEFAGHLYKDSICVEKTQYKKSNKFNFQTPVQEGIYWIVGFARRLDNDKDYSLRSNKLSL